MKSIETEELPVSKAERDEQLIQAVKIKQREIKRDKFDFSYSELVAMYDSEELVLNPEFQRRYRWDIERRSRFIESLILGIPTPPVFVVWDKREEGISWVVIDGLQRLSTVVSFLGKLKIENAVDRMEDEADDFGNSWPLTSTSLLPELEGYTFTQLPRDIQFQIRRAYCRVEVLIPNDDEIDYRFELFARLNTGGAQLTEQEVRNAIYRGSFDQIFDLLSELSKNEDFKTLTHLLSDESRRQMYDQELILRFATLRAKHSYIRKNISLEMSLFLEQDIIQAKHVPDDLEDRFTRICKLLAESTGKDTFKLRTNRFVSTIYDALMVAIDRYLEPYERMQTEQVVSKIRSFKELFIEEKLSAASTGNPSAVKKRIKTALDFFDPYKQS